MPFHISQDVRQVFLIVWRVQTLNLMRCVPGERTNEKAAAGESPGRSVMCTSLALFYPNQSAMSSILLMVVVGVDRINFRLTAPPRFHATSPRSRYALKAFSRRRAHRTHPLQKTGNPLPLD